MRKIAGSRILVVDDIAAEREPIARVFADRGFNVTQAASKKEAQNLLDRTEFDVVVCDMWMETTSAGLDLAAFLRPLQSPYHSGLRVVFIIYTAHNSYRDCVKAIRLGAYDYIGKNEEGSINLLVQSCIDGLRERREWASDPDYEFVQQNWSNLVNKYGESWIAIRAGEVVANSESLKELNAELRSKHPQARPYVVRLKRSVIEQV